MKPPYGRPTKGSRMPEVIGAGIIASLSLALRIQQRGEYRWADAQREFGMSLRSYRRHLDRLRKAGMILDSPMGSRRGMGYVRYVGYDIMFAHGCKLA